MCPAGLVEQRVRRRRLAADDVSDADEELARRLADRFEAWPAAEPVDTSATPDQVLAAALTVLDRNDR